MVATVRLHITPGELGKHGYKGVMGLSLTRRRRALRAAVAELGWRKVRRKLIVLYVFNKYRHPELARTFKMDSEYVATLKQPT